MNIIDPVSYLEMIYLLENCTLVMTDSGGLQKEAYFFKKPCIALRDVKFGNCMSKTESHSEFVKYETENADDEIELPHKWLRFLQGGNHA